MNHVQSRKKEERTSRTNGFGRLLRQWRTRQRFSQLALAVEAEISSRHLSFLETGRAQPSREMVVLLAEVLGVPLRDRNELLITAGYAPLYHETSFDAPIMVHLHRAFDFILRQQEPYPTLLLDRHWNVLKVNEGSAAMQNYFLDPVALAALGPPNAMRLMFHPQAFRPYIVNWEATVASLIQWLHRDAVNGYGDAATHALLDELLSYPDTPHHWHPLDMSVSPVPFLTIHFRKQELDLRFFTTLTTLGTPHDITLQGLRVESFFPADEATEIAMRRLATAKGEKYQ